MNEILDSAETVLRAIQTAFNDQEWSKLAGWGLCLVVGLKAGWAATALALEQMKTGTGKLLNVLFPSPGPVCLAALELLKDEHAVWEEKGGTLLCDGLQVVLDTKGGLDSLTTGEKLEWDVMPSLTRRERGIILAAVRQAVVRVEKRDYEQRRCHTLDRLASIKGRSVMGALQASMARTPEGKLPGNCRS